MSDHIQAARTDSNPVQAMEQEMQTSQKLGATSFGHEPLPCSEANARTEGKTRPGLVQISGRPPARWCMSRPPDLG